jgi:predicted RNA-binding protein YlqC (UPF0109 family)
MDQQAFQTMIGKHQEVQDYISQQRTAISNEVEGAKAQNSGSMINSLVTVHNDWDDDMGKIITNIGSMIDAMQKTASALAAQDASNHA